MVSFDHLIRIADRLAKVEAGNVAADETIHAALGLAGSAPPYTTDEPAVRTLLPAGFDASVLPHPHHGQWGRTLPLSMCGAALRAWAKVGRVD